MASTNPAAFNAFAGDYDTGFTDTRLGRLLRPRVWARLAEAFTEGDQVLELTCGTGEDACWLAQRGVHVTATDGSPEMLKATAEKAAVVGVADRVATRQLSLQTLIETTNDTPDRPSPFDGALSNFGGLNTIGDWRLLARALATQVKPGGIVILVPMGPLCPWEVLWYAAHGEIRTAFRRFGVPATAQIGPTTIPVWYPSARRLRADFSPWFHHRQTESLGLWLPPSYLDHLVNRLPTLFDQLNRLETLTASLSGGWGDHYISIFERR